MNQRLAGRPASWVVFAGATLVTVGLATGCGWASSGDLRATVTAADQPPPSTAAQASFSSMPRLMLSEIGPGDVGPQAFVYGVLGVNDAGCVVLDKRPLIAPKGASMSSDGHTLQMPDGVHLNMGEHLKGGGGYGDDDGYTVPEKWSGCGTNSFVIATKLQAVAHQRPRMNRHSPK